MLSTHSYSEGKVADMSSMKSFLKLNSATPLDHITLTKNHNSAFPHDNKHTSIWFLCDHNLKFIEQ